MKKHRLVLLSLTGFFILLLGCGVKLVPVATPGAEIDQPTDTVSLAKEGVKIAVRAAKPRHIPSWAKGNLTSFLIIICNGTSEEISVDPGNFLLFDEERSQYNAIDPQDIPRHGRYYGFYPFLGFSYWYGFPDNYHFHTALPLYHYDEGPGEMFWRGLLRTEVKAGAKVSGLVYFKAKPEASEKVRLVAVVRKLEGEVKLSFEFTFSLERK